MQSWDDEALALLGRVTSDVTALAATIEVLRRRDTPDPTVLRAERLTQRIYETLTSLIATLKG